jgi:hypothetical protein
VEYHLNGGESITDTFGLRGIAVWMSRSFDTILADLGFVDCGSLDVLLYCADDVAARTSGDMEVDWPR